MPKSFLCFSFLTIVIKERSAVCALMVATLGGSNYYLGVKLLTCVELPFVSTFTAGSFVKAFSFSSQLYRLP